MNEVALRANDVLRNDVMLRINDVALRANGFSPSCLEKHRKQCYNLFHPVKRYVESRRKL